jgi:hypothetical protein
MNKRIGKTILAIVVAVSIAMLPAAVGFAAGSKATDAAVSEPMPDCDHHHGMPSDTTHKRATDCASIAGCGLACFNFTGVTLSGLTFSAPPSAALKPVRLKNKVTSRMGSPPFRPPRS